MPPVDWTLDTGLFNLINSSSPQENSVCTTKKAKVPMAKQTHQVAPSSHLSCSPPSPSCNQFQMII